MNKKYIYIVLVAVFVLVFAPKVLASFTFLSSSFTGTTDATIDLGPEHDLFLQTTGRNIGIGTTTPEYKLDITGDANVTGAYRINGHPISITSNWTLSGNDIYYTTGKVGIGTTEPITILTVGSGTPTTAVNGLNFGTDATANLYRSAAGTIKTDGNMTVGGVLTVASCVGCGSGVSSQWMTTGSDVYYNTGNVGIGTITPAQKLDVDGSIALPTTTDSSTGVIYKGADPFIHNFALAGTDGYNTFIGLNSGNFTMTGSSSGYMGSENTATGYNSLHSNTNGYQNTANGAYSLLANTEGSSNVAVGDTTLSANTTGSGNTALGTQALSTNTSGIRSTAVGEDALHLSTGSYNTAVGAEVLYNDSSGASNSAVGAQSLFNNTTGGFNVANGAYSLYTNSIGSNNVALGYNALSGNGTGSNNVALGNSAGKYETGSNTFYVDNQDRTNTALDKAGALLYGTFDAIPANQTLTTNAVFTPTYGVTVPASQGITLADGAPVVTRNKLYNVGGTLQFNGAAVGGGGGASGSSVVSSPGDATNLAFGSGSLTNATGNVTDSIALGKNSLGALNYGSYNIALGNAALGSATYSNYDIAIGRGALTLVSQGASNIAIGNWALYNFVGNAGADDYNIAIGDFALRNNVHGQKNIALGYFAGKYETGSNAFYVDNQDRTNTAGDKAGALLYGTFDASPVNQRLTINAYPIFSQTSTPASNAACTAGQFTWDASYIYVCTASGVWKRATLTGGY